MEGYAPILLKSSAEFKEQFEKLLRNQPLKKVIDENMVFGDLEKNLTAAWSLLTMAGYLKATWLADTLQGSECQVETPNLEIYSLCRQIVER